MKAEICRAFCDSVTVTRLPHGYGLSTNLLLIDGDPAALYVLGPDPDGRFVLQDAGLLVPDLISSGADVTTSTRREALDAILQTAAARLDEDEMTVTTGPVVADLVPATAFRLLTALVRVADLGRMTRERVRSTFKEDVRAALRAQLDPSIMIEADAPITSVLPEFVADVVIRRSGRVPVALYLAQQDVTLIEAMLARSETGYRMNGARPVVAAMLERESSVSRINRTRAGNRLDVLTVYQDDDAAAVRRVAEVALAAPLSAA